MSELWHGIPPVEIPAEIPKERRGSYRWTRAQYAAFSPEQRKRIVAKIREQEKATESE